MGDDALWRLPGTVRFRITFIAAMVVAAVLTATAFGLVAAQRRQLTDSLDMALVQRAEEILALVASTDGASGGLSASNPDGFALVVGHDGETLAATTTAIGVPKELLAIPPVELQQIRTVQVIPSDDETFRVLSRRVTLSSGPATLHVGEGLDDINESIQALVGSLIIAIPLVVAVLAFLIWWLVGRALAPMEAIRTEVALIGETDLDRRVPEPDTRDEVGRLARTMNSMLQRLEDAAKRQRQFVADASHELRSPLTRMRTEIEVDIANPETADDSLTRQSMLEELIAMQSLVDDLLYLARIDAGEVRSQLAAVDLDDLVLREAEALRRRGTVEVDTTSVSAAEVDGDEKQLSRAIRNLIENAERYASRKVLLSLRETANVAVLRVANDGPSIPSERSDEIFNRFSRLDDARTQSSGGAGL